MDGDTGDVHRAVCWGEAKEGLLVCAAEGVARRHAVTLLTREIDTDAPVREGPVEPPHELFDTCHTAVLPRKEEMVDKIVGKQFHGEVGIACIPDVVEVAV